MQALFGFPLSARQGHRRAHSLCTRRAKGAQILQLKVLAAGVSRGMPGDTTAASERYRRPPLLTHEVVIVPDNDSKGRERLMLVLPQHLRQDLKFVYCRLNRCGMASSGGSIDDALGSRKNAPSPAGRQCREIWTKPAAEPEAEIKDGIEIHGLDSENPSTVRTISIQRWLRRQS